MTPRARPSLLAAVLAVVGLLACSSHDVVIATLAADEGGAGTGPIRCNRPSDCALGSYCDAPSCGAQGTCEFVPAECPGDDRPVCGCDGITYFDDCLRRARGVSSSTPGPCVLADARSCAGPQHRACPAGTTCAILLPPGPCPPDAEGACWVLPPQCPSDFDGGMGHPGPGRPDAWDSCMTGGPTCQDLCTALRNGGPLTRSPLCP